MRRTIIVALALAVLLGTSPGVALAWCNGPTKNGQVGSGYGTHDWILDQAIKQAGPDGAWVLRRTALLATDDPDSAKWPAATQHYNETGSCRGAPQTVSDLYHKAIVAYRAGDMVAASRFLGQLAHCYSDVMQPFHASSASNGYKSLHIRYEWAVDDRQNTSTKSLSWLTRRPIATVTDIRTKTIDAALYSRSCFPSLLSSYKASRSVSGGTPLRITKRVMSRAVNDLADIVASIPTGAGEAEAPSTVDMGLTRTDPRPDDRVGAWVRCLDASGAPMNAVGVRFVWHLPDGDVSTMSYTDANGYICRYQNIGDAPVGQPLSVATIVTVSGATTTTERTFTPTSR